MTLDLRFYLSLILRRLPVIAAIIFTATTAGILYAVSLPPVFRAEARLLIENAQIPDELAASTVRSTADEILLAIQQRIMTRDNLLAIAERHDLFKDAPTLTSEQKLVDIGNRVSIYMPSNQGNTGVVTVSFGASEPQQSSDITNEIADQILQWSTELRTAASANTLDFFEQEVQRLTQELGEQNAKILEFEQANRDALPESLEFRRTRQAAQQERLLQLDRDLASIRDRRQRLTELFDRTGRLVNTDEARTPEEQRLDDLRKELASARVVLSPTNPRIKALENEVSALEEAVSEQLDATGGGRLTPFEVQMLDIDGQIEYLAEQKALVEKDLKALDESIQATPGNSIRLGELRSNYETLRVQYEEAVGSLSEARMGNRIEATDRGQRITMIERAVPPAVRSEPNRKQISVAAFGAGIILSGALLFLLEILNQTIRRPSELAKVIGAPPFGTVGYLGGASSSRRHSSGSLALLAVLLINIPVLMLVVHIYITPLNSLLGLASKAPEISEVADPAATGKTE
jgi:succinoglycan biosynthesis transport protein ExoP